MDLPDNICECLRQFLQAQAANFNAIMDNVRDQSVVVGNGVAPSQALARPELGAALSSSQLLALLILVGFVAFLIGIAPRRRPGDATTAKNGAGRPAPDDDRDRLIR